MRRFWRTAKKRARLCARPPPPQRVDVFVICHALKKRLCPPRGGDARSISRKLSMRNEGPAVKRVAPLGGRGSGGGAPGCSSAGGGPASRPPAALGRPANLRAVGAAVRARPVPPGLLRPGFPAAWSGEATIPQTPWSISRGGTVPLPRRSCSGSRAFPDPGRAPLSGGPAVAACSTPSGAPGPILPFPFPNADPWGGAGPPRAFLGRSGCPTWSGPLLFRGRVWPRSSPGDARASRSATTQGVPRPASFRRRSVRGGAGSAGAGPLPFTAGASRSSSPFFVAGHPWPQACRIVHCLHALKQAFRICLAVAGGPRGALQWSARAGQSGARSKPLPCGCSSKGQVTNAASWRSWRLLPGRWTLVQPPLARPGFPSATTACTAAAACATRRSKARPPPPLAARIPPGRCFWWPPSAQAGFGFALAAPEPAPPPPLGRRFLSPASSSRPNLRRPVVLSFLLRASQSSLPLWQTVWALFGDVGLPWGWSVGAVLLALPRQLPADSSIPRPHRLLPGAGSCTLASRTGSAVPPFSPFHPPEPDPGSLLLHPRPSCWGRSRGCWRLGCHTRRGAGGSSMPRPLGEVPTWADLPVWTERGENRGCQTDCAALPPPLGSLAPRRGRRSPCLLHAWAAPGGPQLNGVDRGGPGGRPRRKNRALAPSYHAPPPVPARVVSYGSSGANPGPCGVPAHLPSPTRSPNLPAGRKAFPGGGRPESAPWRLFARGGMRGGGGGGGYCKISPMKSRFVRQLPPPANPRIELSEMCPIRSSPYLQQRLERCGRAAWPVGKSTSARRRPSLFHDPSCPPRWVR